MVNNEIFGNNMNIFYLHKDPIKNAEYHCDKHIVKMATEYCQLLSTAHRVLDGQIYLGKTKSNRNIKRWLHRTAGYTNEGESCQSPIKHMGA